MASTSLQAAEERTLELNGRVVRYAVSAVEIESAAAATARRIHEHLARGEIEEAALLSNTPKRRYEIYRDYRERVGGDSFKEVFSRYLDPANRILAEIAIGPQRLLVWEVADLAEPTGEFFVEIEGRTFMDDVPSETRQDLRQILERYRKSAKTLP